MKLRTVRIRTKNPSAIPLRGQILVPFLSVARLGSLTPLKSVFPNRDLSRIVECNTTDAIENSRNKLRMKKCFTDYDIPQAIHWDSHLRFPTDTRELPYPIVAKKIYGFKAKGMKLLNSKEELDSFISKTNLEGYFFEKFYNFGKEYRIHATPEKAFLSWRKLRREDADQKWYFNSSNCNWVSEEHELFQKPSNWKELEQIASLAIQSTGLDIGAVDIRIQSSSSNPKYIVCEVNSAPQLGEVGVVHYIREIKNLLVTKFNKL